MVEDAIALASMEPCLFRHGKEPLLVRYLGAVDLASMEPCLFRHGKSAKKLWEDGYTDASMEPCLFRHGKRDPATVPGSSPRLQWSHVFSDMVRTASSRDRASRTALQWSHVFSDMVRVLKAQIAELQAKLQWSHVFSDMVRKRYGSVRSSTSSRFNGAMSFQTW